MAQTGSVAALLLLATLTASHAACPYASSSQALGPDRKLLNENGRSLRATEPAGGYDAVVRDIRAALTDSQAFWPADFGNYGPFLIRLAWHCSGSYRTSDGRGGCDGGRIRFNPEHSWPDNTNLDKALRLLQPIKLKYGPSLSWGDLIILAGNTAIESMGGPVLGFCGGRVDDPDGQASLELGPTPEQEAIAPCKVNGKCGFPLGPSTIGLIYVNPEGVMGVPDPVPSGPNIRNVFGRMGMRDRETVALAGGGHAFGKVHGACPTGPGPSPLEDPGNPWPGTCGTGELKGKGPNTFTSGFEGSWVTTPTKWSNQYFQNLLEYNWVKHKGPGGHFQWKPLPKNVNETVDKIMMLTADVAFLHDVKYHALLKEYAHNISALEYEFAHAWYKLTTSDMGPVTRCIGNRVPPAQPFQMPLPEHSDMVVDIKQVRKQINALLTANTKFLPPDLGPNRRPYYGALFVNLAWQCASTFRATDYKGGCNGARIRFAPQKNWPINIGMDRVISVLRVVKQNFPLLSWADLIVLAGTTALEKAGGIKLPFCGGRVDAVNGQGDEILAPRKYEGDILTVRDNMKVMGLTSRDVVALAGRIRSPTQQHRLGYRGSYTEDPTVLSNVFYTTLLQESWVRLPGNKTLAKDVEYKASGGFIYATASDLALIWDPEFHQIVVEYASDEMAFHTDFAAAWTKVMNADRFGGPTGNLCD